MSTIFKTRISQQEVQTPVVSADTVVTDNFIASSFQSESVSSEEVLADLVSAVTIESDEVFATDTNTTNLVVTNDFSLGGDVIVSSGNVLVSKGGTVSFLDDGEIVEEDGATGFPVFTGIPEILNNGTIYNIGLIDKDTDLSGIHFSGNDKMVQTCEIWFSVGDETHDIYWPENMLWLDSTDGNAPAIVVRTEYRVAIRKEANGSMVASIAYALGEGRMIIGESEPYELTAEAIQEVAPIAWGSNAVVPNAFGGSLAIGNATATAGWGVTVGHNAKTKELYSTAIGMDAESWMHSIAITARGATVKQRTAITIGSIFSDTAGSYTCTTEGTGSITIGAGANTLNNGTTESSNSVTIGCKAENKGADSVVIGAQAKNPGNVGGIYIGTGATTHRYDHPSIAIGKGAQSPPVGVSIGINAICTSGADNSVIIGSNTKSSSGGAVCIGGAAQSSAKRGVAIGDSAKVGSGEYGIALGALATVNDYGATVIRSTAEDGTYTQLYFSGANTPLANTYENGEAMMGYVVRDSAGNVMTDAEGNAMVGTQKLSVLFPNNRGENAFTPAMLGLDDEWTPKPMFRPSDLDMPQEEPTEPEEYTPLPVYPIVEPKVEEI